MNRFITGLSISVAVLLGAVLKPKIQELGLLRKIENLNNQRCSRIEGLEACEDIFVDQPTGKAYLACSHRKHRAHWVPAINVLNYHKLQSLSEDYVAILDLKTLEYRKLQLENLPASLLQNGVHVHGLDLFVHPESASNSPRQATIYLINHRFPDHQDNGLGTADSVIEVFDTVIGSDRATHRRTIQHDLIVTPNNLVGLNHNSFYATNDHRTRKHWTRDLEILFLDSPLNGVVHCSFDQTTLHCIPALHGRYQFPNGIAKGPGNTIYMSNTLNAYLRWLEIQPDNTLVVKAEIKVPRVIDNLYVTSSGSVFIAAIPSISRFQNLMAELHQEKFTLVSPSEVWKVSNMSDKHTSSSPTRNQFSLEKVFADDGNQVSCTTGVAVWDSKLFMTGIASPYVSVCEIDRTLAF